MENNVSDDAVLTILSAWKGPLGSISSVRDTITSIVVDEDTHAFVLGWIVSYQERAKKIKKKLEPLEEVLKHLTPTSQPSASRPEATSSPSEIVTTNLTPDSFDSDFEGAWSQWPIEGRGEKKEVVFSAWKNAVSRYGIDSIKKAICAYMQYWATPANAVVHPYRMYNFLTREGVIHTWLHRPNEKAEDVNFNVFWRTYPDYPAKTRAKEKRDVYVLWQRHCPPDLWLDYFAEVKCFRFERRDESEKYTISMGRHLGEWASSLSEPRRLSQNVRHELATLLVADVASEVPLSSKKRGVLQTILEACIQTHSMTRPRNSLEAVQKCLAVVGVDSAKADSVCQRAWQRVVAKSR